MYDDNTNVCTADSELLAPNADCLVLLSRRLIMISKNFGFSSLLIGGLVTVLSSNAIAQAANLYSLRNSASSVKYIEVMNSFLDVKYYLGKYPDLQKAFGTDTAAVSNHWREYGAAECRQPSASLSPQKYLLRYPDLKSAFGNDCFGALNHWYEYGQKEGRNVGPIDRIKLSYRYIYSVTGGGANRVEGMTNILTGTGVDVPRYKAGDGKALVNLIIPKATYSTISNGERGTHTVDIQPETATEARFIFTDERAQMWEWRIASPFPAEATIESKKLAGGGDWPCTVPVVSSGSVTASTPACMPKAPSPTINTSTATVTPIVARGPGILSCWWYDSKTGLWSIPMLPIKDEAYCKVMDSCTPQGGKGSGGGCYKWSTPEKVTQPAVWSSSSSTSTAK